MACESARGCEPQLQFPLRTNRFLTQTACTLLRRNSSLITQFFSLSCSFFLTFCSPSPFFHSVYRSASSTLSRSSPFIPLTSQTPYRCHSSFLLFIMTHFTCLSLCLFFSHLSINIRPLLCNVLSIYLSIILLYPLYTHNLYIYIYNSSTF